jgi:hypothetical protein
LVDKAVARSQMKLATAVAKYDLVATGLADGVVSQDKARVITQALDAVENDPAASAGDLIPAEKLLVDYATQLTANELKIVGRRILTEIDPERFEAAEAKALQREEEHAKRRSYFQSRDNGDGTIDIHARDSRAVGMRLHWRPCEGGGFTRCHRLVKARGGPPAARTPSHGPNPPRN